MLLGISINPSSVEGFFPGLSAIGSAYGKDLYPGGILGLSHADVIAMLFDLIFFFLNLSFCLLRLNFGFLRLIFEPLGFLQLFLKGCQLLLRISINPSTVEGFFPSLSAVDSAYGGALCPEGVLGLSHADVIVILLGLIFFFLNLDFCLLASALAFSA